MSTKPRVRCYCFAWITSADTWYYECPDGTVHRIESDCDQPKSWSELFSNWVPFIGF